jgi:hypothetical protein
MRRAPSMALTPLNYGFDARRISRTIRGIARPQTRLNFLAAAVRFRAESRAAGVALAVPRALACGQNLAVVH